MDQGNRKVAIGSGLRLAIDLGIEVSIDSPRVSGRFRSELVGMLPGRYLILSEPVKPVGSPFHAEYRDGDSVIVRYLFRGSIFGFRTFLCWVWSLIPIACCSWGIQHRSKNTTYAPQSGWNV